MDVALIAGLVVVFTAGVTQGMTGFGFSLVFVSLMLALLPPVMVIPVVTILAVLINIFIVAGVRKDVDIKRILPLMLAGAAGMPFGAYILVSLDVNVMRLISGVLIALFAIAYLSGFERKVHNERTAFLWVGILSGLFNGSIGMSGPPVIFFFTNQGMKKDVFKANLVAYFMILNLVTLGAFVLKGLVTGEVLLFAASLAPAMAAGAFSGMWLAGKVNEAFFKRVALVIVLVAGGLCFASGLRNYF